MYNPFFIQLESVKKLKEVETELAGVKNEVNKWKVMCAAMELKLIEQSERNSVGVTDGNLTDVNGNEEEGEGEGEEEEETGELEGEGEEEGEGVEMDQDEEEKEVEKEVIELKKSKKIQKKGVSENGIKDRKLPKNIKENPPTRGKNISSKEKKDGKKKNKLRLKQ